MAEATLYSIRVSHPARAAGMMLRHKAIEFDRVDLPPGSQQVVVRLRGFRHGTVPALKIGGRRIQGTREIAKALDQLRPDPPLFPDDPTKRAEVEEAERWGEQVYQPIPRRIFRWAAANDGQIRKAMAVTGKLPAPGVTATLLWPVTQVYVRFEGGGEKAVRRDLAELPGHLDHVDRLVGAGTIGGGELNAADFQIATTTRVLLNFEQLRPLIEGRPAAEHADRVIPGFKGEMPVRIPPEWVPERR